MRKAGHDIGRDQVARLMAIVGIEGVRRGKHKTVTTTRDPKAARHPDLIRRRGARRPTRMSGGLRTSPTCGPSRVSSTPASSPTSARDGSFAGGPPRRRPHHW
jgi:hypothetical protein